MRKKDDRNNHTDNRHPSMGNLVMVFNIVDIESNKSESNVGRDIKPKKAAMDFLESSPKRISERNLVVVFFAIRFTMLNLLFAKNIL